MRPLRPPRSPRPVRSCSSNLADSLVGGSAVFCLAVVSVLAGPLPARAAAESAPPGHPVSPSKVLQAVQYAGPMALRSFGPMGQEGESPDHSLSPYLYVAGGDPAVDRVPLKKTWAEVDIAGVIAAVKVHQVFENTGAKPIEAVYVFPASTRAAVHAMRMKIGTRTIEAKIERRAEARARYEAAKQAGKRASLLEQQRPNVFTTSVANIMPGDRIEVELDYSEMLVPQDSVYEFVYPAVVGPRYAGGANPKTNQWMANPYLSEGKPEPYDWNLKVHLQTGIPIRTLSSPSHKIAVTYAGRSSADIKIDQKGGGNKDFVLRYQLAGNKIETGLLQYAEPAAGLNRPAEKFFALLVEPPLRPALADIPGREYIFLLDVSGSMYGFPIDTAKELMRNLLGKLRPTDHFDLVLFSGANYVWSPSGSRPATPANIQEALDIILKQRGGGGTELMGGLRAAYAIPRLGKGVSRTVVVVSDGYVGVEAQAFRFIRERLDQANLFAFGIGSSVNRALIEGMARAGLGQPFVVLGPQAASAEAEKLRRMIDRPILTDVRMHVRGAGVYEVAPEKIPDLLAERPLLIYGKYRGDEPIRIEVSGRTGRGAFHHAVDLRPADAGPENQALRALWARKWVQVLEDEHAMGAGKPVEDAITNLGLSYDLLTPFTSFVAVDSEVVHRGGQVETIRQPLPMPEGVSNYALSGARRMMAPAGAGGGALHMLGLRASEAVPASVPTSAPIAKKAEREPRRSLEEKPGGKSAVCKVVVKVGKVEHAGDAGPLQAAVERAVRVHGCALAGTLKLRITIDGSGKIVKVVRLTGERQAGIALARWLDGTVTATRSLGQAQAVLVLTVRVMAP